MAKKLKHDNLSSVFCATPGCARRIKQRLINLSPRFTKCYFCHCQDEAKRGHYVNKAPRKSRIEAGQMVKSFGGGV